MYREFTAAIEERVRASQGVASAFGGGDLAVEALGGGRAVEGGQGGEKHESGLVFVRHKRGTWRARKAEDGTRTIPRGNSIISLSQIACKKILQQHDFLHQ